MRKADNKFYFEIYFSFIKYFPSFFFLSKTMYFLTVNKIKVRLLCFINDYFEN